MRKILPALLALPLLLTGCGSKHHHQAYVPSVTHVHQHVVHVVHHHVVHVKHKAKHSKKH